MGQTQFQHKTHSVLRADSNNMTSSDVEMVMQILSQLTTLALQLRQTQRFVGAINAIHDSISGIGSASRHEVREHIDMRTADSRQLGKKNHFEFYYVLEIELNGKRWDRFEIGLYARQACSLELWLPCDYVCPADSTFENHVIIVLDSMGEFSTCPWYCVTCGSGRRPSFSGGFDPPLARPSRSGP